MSNLLKNSIINIIDKYDEMFLTKKNVIGIGFGNKHIKEIDSYEPCLQVLVEKKVPKDTLCKKHIIPKEFLGIKTDVVESGTMLGYTSSTEIKNNTIPNFKERTRPLQVGYSIGPIGVKFCGTLGAIVFDNEDNTPYILSNNHVLCARNKFKLGHPIIQPGTNDGGDYNFDVIAHVYKRVMLNYITGYINYADCAIAKINPSVNFNNFIYNTGTIPGIIEPELNMKIKKVGRTTGYTNGTVIATHVSMRIQLEKDGPFCRFKEQIHCTRLSAAGDSGSLLVDIKSNRAVALLLGGNDGKSTGSPITKVLNYFNIHF